VIAAVVVSLGVTTAVAFALLGGGGTPQPPRAPGPGSPSAPPRAAFVLPLAKTSTVALRKRNAGATRNAVTAIQTTLSGFYDAAFMDPKTWKEGLPSGAWEAFVEGLRDQAKADAGALTLGEAAATMERLDVTNASLSVRLLLDPKGRPTAAFATVVLDGSATLAGDEPVIVSNRATFLMRPSGGQWLVAGYPRVTTNVESPPSPSPGAGGTPSPTPSGSASP
jgi:hypothetical protein